MQTTEEWFRTHQVKFGASGGAKSKNNAAARGIAYHQRVYKLLRAEFLINHRGWYFEPEPWFRGRVSRKLCSPDGVAVLMGSGSPLAALAIEVKLNWKDGRDQKLLDLYVPVLSCVYGVKAKPVLITRNVRGLQHEPLVGLAGLMQALRWQPGNPTPVVLVP